MDIIKKGEVAPDFALEDQDGKLIKLSDLKGKKILLSYHPLAWTPVCTDQMRSLERKYDEIKEKGVDLVLGISVDSQPSKAVWAKALGIENVRIVSDFEPKGEMSKAYGVYLEDMGTSGRANILIGEDGKIAWSKEYDIPELPCVSEVIEKL